jgi:hypothetical protein
MTARSKQPLLEQGQYVQARHKQSRRVLTQRAQAADGQIQKRQGNFPVRTCVGCKERAAKSSLLRLVAAGNDIVPDPRARQPGRGAYLHPSLDCLEKARRRRAFSRALRVTSPLGTDPLALYLSQDEAAAGNRETCTESRSRS